MEYRYNTVQYYPIRHKTRQSQIPELKHTHKFQSIMALTCELLGVFKNWQYYNGIYCACVAIMLEK